MQTMLEKVRAAVSIHGVYTANFDCKASPRCGVVRIFSYSANREQFDFDYCPYSPSRPLPGVRRARRYTAAQKERIAERERLLMFYIAKACGENIQSEEDYDEFYSALTVVLNEVFADAIAEAIAEAEALDPEPNPSFPAQLEPIYPIQPIVRL